MALMKISLTSFLHTAKKFRDFSFHIISDNREDKTMDEDYIHREDWDDFKKEEGVELFF